jgi:hypothetical protein
MYAMLSWKLGHLLLSDSLLFLYASFRVSFFLLLLSSMSHLSCHRLIHSTISKSRSLDYAPNNRLIDNVMFQAVLFCH